MAFITFIKGLLLGFGLSIPIGPVGILCLRHSLTKGRKAGMLSGLGAATADMIYAASAAYGISFIINPIRAHQNLFQCIGWLTLATTAHHFRSQISLRILDTINTIASSAIIIFGIAAIGSSLWHHMLRML